MKILHLTVKKKWFDMIASGEKTEEYREIKSYWVNRLIAPKNFTEDWYPDEMATEFKRFPDSVEGAMKVFDVKWKKFDSVKFVNGYGKNAPSVVLEFKGVSVGKATPDWSDNWQGDVFIIKLGEIIKNKS